ncbi:MAG: TonB-dependent receptor [Pseudomonadota bacterium]
MATTTVVLVLLSPSGQAVGDNTPLPSLGMEGKADEESSANATQAEEKAKVEVGTEVEEKAKAKAKAKVEVEAPAEAKPAVEAAMEVGVGEGMEGEPSGLQSSIVVVEDLWPASTVAFSGDELVRRGFRTLGDALSFVVGVEVERTSRGARFAMRGIAGGILLIVDGVPIVFASEADSFDAEGLDLADVDQVEVVRGPVSATSGLGSLSGAVRVRTKRPSLLGARVRLGGTFQGELEVGGTASVQRGRLALRVTALRREGVGETWRLQGVPTRFLSVGKTILPVTMVDRDVAPLGGTTTAVHAVATAGGVRLDFGHSEIEKYSPLSSFSHGLLDGSEQQRLARDRQRLSLSWHGMVGPTHLQLMLFGSRRGRLDKILLYPPEEPFPAGGAITLAGTSLNAGFLARLDAPIRRYHRLVASVFGDLAKQRARGSAIDPTDGSSYPDLVVLDSSTAMAAGAVEYQGDFGAGWHVTLGAGVDWQAEHGWTVAPRVAAVYLPRGWLSLRVAYSEGCRAPDRLDLGALAQAVVAGQIVGAAENDDLRPERARTAEAGVSISASEWLRLEILGFASRHEDMVLEKVSDAYWVVANQEPRTVAGAESELQVELVPSVWRFQLGGAFASTVAGPDGSDRLATILGASEVTPARRFAVGARSRAVWRESRAQPDSSVVFDVYSHYRLRFRRGSELVIAASLLNATEAREASQDHAALPGALGVLVPGGGRSLFLSVEGAL